MTQTWKKVTALGLCAALALGGVGIAFAENNATAEEPQISAAPSEEKTEEVTAVSKDETVYVLTENDGTVQKIIVSDWLKNTFAENTLSDRSELSEIKNVKGEEGYTESGDSKVWDAQGNDIYYRGNIDKELPVSLRVTYTLDGTEISPAELAGKSGKVTIRFDYENRQYERVEVNGSKEKIYVPFAMLTGMILDNETFRNVSVSNGKLINDGDRTVIVGVAFPGLQENLNVSTEKIELPSYVEVTADVTDFSLGMTVTLATNEVFNDLNTDDFNLTDGMGDSIKELTDAMEQLMDGSSALYDGLYALAEKSEELAMGVNQLDDGAKALWDGTVSADAGAGQLQAGLTELSGGLNSLSASSGDLQNGAKQVFDSLLSTATAQLQGAGLSVPALSIENYSDVLGGIITQLGGATAETAQSVVTLKASLDSYMQFYQGVMAYTGGVDSVAAGANTLSVGANTLKAGTEQLKNGAETLYSGTATLKNSMPTLTSGVEQLRDGAKELSDGLVTFNEQGVQKLVELIDGDLEGIVDRLKATVTVSQNYQNFTGLSDDMDGQVKFIYRTAEVK